MWASVLYLITTVLLAYGLRLVLLREPKKLHGVYSEPDVWFVYWARWMCKVVEVWALQLSRRRRVNNYDVTGSSYDLCGIEATPSEKELELPKPLITDRHEDSMLIWGADEAGRGVVARVVRQTQRRASVFLSVVDQTGDVYTLPNQPDSNLVNVTGAGWRGGGLSLQCVDPMRCWRLKFNGLLRRGPREEYITDDKDDTDDSEVIHARLDFLWRAVRCPVDVFNDASPLLLAHALAREPAASVKLFTSLERDGYDQWGALHGMVTIKDSPEEWYLRGCRQHRWGISETVANFYRSVDIFSYFNSGEVCSLQAFSYSSGLSHYVIGYVQEASGRYRPVTSTTLSLPHLAEKAPLPKNLLTRFTTSSGNYDLWHKLGPKVTHYTGDPWSLCHVLNFNSVAINHSFGYGITLFSDRFKGLCPVPERECLPALVEPRVEIDEATAFVVPLIDHRTRATCLTGGKASSLAFLMSLKDITDDEYEVPDGVVVTVAAWRQQLRTYPELQTAVRGVEKAVGCSQQAQLKDACARAVESFRSTPVCPKVAEALRQTLEETFEQNYQSRRFAVRSSGCSEDGEETSAAGQNETRLGVVGGENLLRALAACWASLFTFQSVEYRRHFFLQLSVLILQLSEKRQHFIRVTTLVSLWSVAWSEGQRWGGPGSRPGHPSYIGRSRCPRECQAHTGGARRCHRSTRSTRRSSQGRGRTRGILRLPQDIDQKWTGRISGTPGRVLRQQPVPRSVCTSLCGLFFVCGRGDRCSRFLIYSPQVTAFAFTTAGSMCFPLLPPWTPRIKVLSHWHFLRQFFDNFV